MCTFLHPEVGLRAHIIATAQPLVEQARYCYLGEECRPPETVNCGMLVRWVFAQRGFWGPGGVCGPPIGDQLLPGIKKKGQVISRPRPGDLIFIQQHGRAHEHVGILAFDDAVIHACSQRGTVVTDSIAEFWQSSSQTPCCVSLLEDSAGLTPRDIGQYLRGELSPEVTQIIDSHALECFDCEMHIELTRRYKTWKVPKAHVG